MTRTPQILLASALLALCLAPASLLAQTGSAEEAAAPDVAAEEAVVTPMSPIMDEPLDGSSDDALRASLEKVKAESTAGEFMNLQKSIGLYRSYDMSLRSNPSALASRLDKKSPREVIDMVKKRFN